MGIEPINNHQIPPVQYAQKSEPCWNLTERHCISISQESLQNIACARRSAASCRSSSSSLSHSLPLVPVDLHEILLRLTMSNSHASRRVAAFSTRLAPLFRLHQVLPLCSVSSRKTCSKIHINSFSYYSIYTKALIILLPGFSAEVQVLFFSVLESISTLFTSSYSVL